MMISVKGVQMGKAKGMTSAHKKLMLYMGQFEIKLKYLPKIWNKKNLNAQTIK